MHAREIRHTPQPKSIVFSAGREQLVRNEAHLADGTSMPLDACDEATALAIDFPQYDPPTDISAGDQPLCGCFADGYCIECAQGPITRPRRQACMPFKIPQLYAAVLGRTGNSAMAQRCNCPDPSVVSVQCSKRIAFRCPDRNLVIRTARDQSSVAIGRQREDGGPVCAY